jgi:hypothetical protein
MFLIPRLMREKPRVKGLNFYLKSPNWTQFDIASSLIEAVLGAIVKSLDPRAVASDLRRAPVVIV